MNVSFNGKVFLAGSTSYLSKKNEIEQLSKYAKRKDCDVLVLDRDYYCDNTGKYQTLVVKEDKTTGANHFYSKIFDFKSAKPSNSSVIELDFSV